MKTLTVQAVQLLEKLISIPSFSTSESEAADHIDTFLREHEVATMRKFNNIWCYSKALDSSKPTLLLNSHMDTVQPNAQYSLNPFLPTISNGKLFGLGSNDAGGALVSLVATFLHFYNRTDLPFNLCLAITGEEENSGAHGIRSILDDLMPIAFAIVGEPTEMEMAIAEKGSMVLDCVAMGRAGHAAREEGDNAIYRAIRDISWFASYEFPADPGQPKAVKMTVTEIKGGIQHNIVPGECSFSVDIRFDHNYSVKEIVNTIKNHTFCETTIRPNILYPSTISPSHVLVRAGYEIGRQSYLSPTSSDQGWLKMPSMKMGPGNSARSHTADEFIYLSEINEGIRLYIELLETLSKLMSSEAQLKSLSFAAQMQP